MQWDPERDYRLGALPYRGIQIGISGEVGSRWVEEWIEGIEDVTERARGLKRGVDEGVQYEDLLERGLLLGEKEYEVSEELRKILQMDEMGGET